MVASLIATFVVLLGVIPALGIMSYRQRKLMDKQEREIKTQIKASLDSLDGSRDVGGRVIAMHHK